MHCSSCGTPMADGARFCPSCGTPASQPQAGPPADQAPTQQIPPEPAATQQMPAQPAAPQAPMQAGAPPQGPGAVPGGFGTPPPPPPSHTGLILGLVALAVVVVAGAGVGAYFLFFRGDGAETTGQTTATETVAATSTPSTGDAQGGQTAGGATQGFDSPEAAMEAYLPADWVYTEQSSEGDSVVYWAGPPQSEYVSGYRVTMGQDGKWTVVDDWDLAGDVPDPGASGGQSSSGWTNEQLAELVVDDFLRAVYEDRADDAHDLTTQPFSEDPASAQFSNGDLSGWTIQSSYAGDGGYWVEVEEYWAWGTEYYRYHLVEADVGKLIDQLEPY